MLKYLQKDCTTDNIGEKMKHKPFCMVVRAFISDGNDNFLLIQRSDYEQYWEVPGGKVDPGETFDRTLIREVREETSLSVVLDGVAGVSEFETPEARFVVLFMNAHSDSSNIKISAEHKNFAWLPLSEFHSKKLTHSLQNVLKSM